MPLHFTDFNSADEFLRRVGLRGNAATCGFDRLCDAALYLVSTMHLL